MCCGCALGCLLCILIPIIIIIVIGVIVGCVVGVDYDSYGSNTYSSYYNSWTRCTTYYKNGYWDDYVC